MEVIFDLDGTLIDSLHDLSASASELATSLGGRSLEPQEIATMIGDGASVLVKRVLAAAGVDPATPDALPRFLRIYDRRLLDTTIPYRGVPEMLSMAARRARLTVLTNKPIGPSTRILDGLGLTAFFDAVIGGDGPEGRKPNPAGLRALARGSSKVVLVGDSPIDWETSQAAGCSFAWARYGFGAARFDGNSPETPYVLEQPADLSSVLDRFAAIATGA